MPAIAWASSAWAGRALRDPFDPLVLVDVDLRHLRHSSQHGEREAFVGEEDTTEPDPDRGLDRLQPDPVREAVRVRDAVGEERGRDRRLEEAYVAGPEGKDRDDVHEHE